MSASAPGRLQVALLTLVALGAFAANSLLCRMALSGPDIDPASFTTLRIASGALLLWLVIGWRAGSLLRAPAGSWSGAFMLFLYAVLFSFAYLGLHAGTGALILFGAVQITMIVAGLRTGERLDPLQWLGLGAALAGLCYLLLPGAGAPPLSSALLMAGAGLAWGLYSLIGRGGGDPIDATAGNFIRALPFALAVSLASMPILSLGAKGMALALVSGAITSGLGYVVWYRVLPRLRATSAAASQLSVPVITAVAGVLLLNEPLTLRLLFSGAVVLGGIALVIQLRPGSTR
jgi:drug/metabolite transporter (DMT)-like permease